MSKKMSRRYLCALCLLVPGLAGAEPLDDAKLLLKKRKYVDAIAHLEPLATSDTTGEATYCLAMAFDLSGNAPRAIEAYKKVVDGKGKRAPEAERSMKALEAIINEATSVERARVDFERAGLEGSTRLKEARERGETARNKLAERERDAQKKQRERDTAITNANEAKHAKERAEKIASDWKGIALASPSGRGRGFRALGSALTAFGGIGLGASLWYMRTAQTATDRINEASIPGGTWTSELEHYSHWGQISDDRLPYSLAVGGALTLSGWILLGLGEAALDDEADRADVSAAIGGPR
jgi:hypothetical protein